MCCAIGNSSNGNASWNVCDDGSQAYIRISHYVKVSHAQKC